MGQCRTDVTRVDAVLRLGTLADLGGSAQLLGWDRETVMPKAGAEGRARQLGTLAALHHRELVRDDAGEAIAALREDGELDDDARAMLRLAVRERRRAGCRRSWCARSPRPARARPRPGSRRGRPTTSPPSPGRSGASWSSSAARPRRSIGDEPYDALLDGFEPGARAAQLEPVLADLRERLAPIVAAASAREPAELPPRDWPRRARWPSPTTGEPRGLRGDGRLARSAHPFTSSPHAGDVRYDPARPLEPAQQHQRAVMHELGHALYEQGLPADVDRTPLHDARPRWGPTSRSRASGRTRSGTRSRSGGARAVPAAPLPEAMTGLDPR